MSIPELLMNRRLIIALIVGVLVTSIPWSASKIDTVSPVIEAILRITNYIWMPGLLVALIVSGFKLHDYSFGSIHHV